MMVPRVIKGRCHTDDRGILRHNNGFNMKDIVRFYLIENADIELQRGWKAHRIERRWFTVVQGSYRIKVVSVDSFSNWKNNNLPPHIYDFIIDDENLDVLSCPKGYATLLQSMNPESKILCMSDYRLGEVDDDLRYDKNYFDEIV